jgi:hypothetical protein
MVLQIEKRISKLAEKSADDRFDRSDPAWHRAYHAAYESSCREDADCGRTKRANREAVRAAGELVGRIEAVKAARDAARGPAGKALVAAERTQDDFPNRDLVKAAREASRLAYQACRESKP